MRITDGWNELMAVESRMDRYFRRDDRPEGEDVFSGSADVRSGDRCLPTDGDLVTRIDLPGIGPAKDVTVTVEDGDLVICRERKKTEEVKEEDYCRMETSYGGFERRKPLSEGVKEDDVKAEYHDGILEVRLPAPKAEVEAPKAKAIPIKATGKPAAA